MTSLKCRQCGGLFGSGNIRVLSHHGELWFLSVYCPHCQGQALLALSVKRERSPRPVTDLSPQEIASFAELPPISGDEVLDLHMALRDFDGDFASTFSRG